VEDIAMDFWQLLGLAEDKQKEKPATSDGKFLSTKVNECGRCQMEQIAETALLFIDFSVP
jgi:hypothetical protein